jgi:putative transposase
LLRCDKGSSFISKVLDKWSYKNGVTLDFSRRGKPTDNAFAESFNGGLRDECLNIHHLEALEDAREKLSAWRQEYNERRPHSALDYQMPSAFAAAMRVLKNEQTYKTPDSLV